MTTTRPAADNLVGRSLWFEGPRKAGLRWESIREPRPGEILVQAIVSLISPGTEMQVFRGQVSDDVPLGLETCEGRFGFPVKYAYQVVGRIVAVGEGASLSVGTMVFCRHPHQELFTIRCDPRLVLPLPEGIRPEVAAFLQLGDVALNAHLDVPVRIGDNVAVFGFGIVGQFCAHFARTTAAQVFVIDPQEERRRMAVDRGFTAVHTPEEAPAAVAALTGGGVDVAFEVSGAPAALQHALDLTGQEGTVVVVSYYGSRPVTLTLSPAFHFGRQRIISSQVGQIAGTLQPRWDRERRSRTTLARLETLPVQSMVTHEVSFEEAPRAYDLLDTGGGDVLGVLLRYPS